MFMFMFTNEESVYRGCLLSVNIRCEYDDDNEVVGNT